MFGKKSRPIVGKLSDLLIPRNKPSFFNPKLPLDFKSSSPKRYDICGVGLGIVAALEKSTFTDCRNRAIRSSNLNAMVVDSGKGFDRRTDDLEEDYPRHAPGNPSAKVYYNGDEQRKKKETRFAKDDDVVYSTPDFLSFCQLCRKELHGKDIYMYRGEVGFCSEECRWRQIMEDERKEHYRSKASRSTKFSTSPYNNADQIFSTGILAI
ncbi:hypothetical protein V6N13_114632 [Hibiscus sabdariffa]|uniref:FLZ-type domain-containing protein n=1 Tax=Hibiscus sabdariffa TaxID=183260 RepID=A0ABR2U351_9ROSI